MTKKANQAPVLFSAKINIALSIAGELAISKEVLSVSEIASRLCLSISYVEQILPNLKSAGIVLSKKGPNGGYWLKSNKLTVRDVVKAIYGGVFDCELNSALFAKLEELMGTTTVLEMNRSNLTK